MATGLINDRRENCERIAHLIKVAFPGSWALFLRGQRIRAFLRICYLLQCLVDFGKYDYKECLGSLMIAMVNNHWIDRAGLDFLAAWKEGQFKNVMLVPVAEVWAVTMDDIETVEELDKEGALEQIDILFEVSDRSYKAIRLVAQCDDFGTVK